MILLRAHQKGRAGRASGLPPTADAFSVLLCRGQVTARAQRAARIWRDSHDCARRQSPQLRSALHDIQSCPLYSIKNYPEVIFRASKPHSRPPKSFPRVHFCCAGRAGFTWTTPDEPAPRWSCSCETGPRP